MRVQLLAVGTTGSVAPYTGLAHRLAADGHDVEVVTHAKFAGLVTCCGLRMRPIDGDPFEALVEVPTAGPVRSLATLPERARAARRAAVSLVDDLLAAVDPHADLVLCSTLAAPIGAAAARYHGIPSAGVFLQPDVPTTAFAPCVLGWRRPGYANVVRGHAANAVVDLLFGPAVRRLYTRLGLTVRDARELRRERERARWPIWHGYSPAVLPRPADWRPGLHVAGYWWPHECPQWTPPAPVVDFLAAGPAPVLVGFGSMRPGDAERLGPVVRDALRRAGVRAIVQAGWAGLSVVDDDVITVGALPHGWLMPRTAAVVHHAGAGTSAAALRAGVPAVPVPMLTDQPWWAARLAQLGVAVDPLPYAELTAPRLADALVRATRDPTLARNAAALADRLAREDGATTVCRAIDELVRPPHRQHHGGTHHGRPHRVPDNR